MTDDRKTLPAEAKTMSSPSDNVFSDAENLRLPQFAPKATETPGLREQGPNYYKAIADAARDAEASMWLIDRAIAERKAESPKTEAITSGRETIREIIDRGKFWTTGGDADGYNVAADHVANEIALLLAPALSDDLSAQKSTEAPGLREALKPIAELASEEQLSEWPPHRDGMMLAQYGTQEITVGDVRRARAALSATPHSLPNMPGLRDAASIEAAYEEYRLRPVSGHADGFSPVVPALKHAFFAGAEAASTVPSPLSAPNAVPDEPDDAKARLWTYNYLSERAQALGESHDVDELQESALDIVEGYKKYRPSPSVSVPDYGEERNDYISSEKAREMFGDEDDDEPLSDRIRVCDGEWVRIPGGYYFDKSAGPLHPEVTSHDDGAGRDEIHPSSGSVWSDLNLPEPDLTTAYMAGFDQGKSAERAAHEQTRRDLFSANTVVELLREERDAERADVSRLRKALEEAKEDALDQAWAAADWRRTREDLEKLGATHPDHRAAARSSREEIK